MKKLNYFVMLSISASLMLASCSQQRYASRAKVRVNQATEQVKEEKKELATIVPAPQGITSSEIKQKEVVKAVIPEKATPKPKEVLKQLTSKESRTFIKEVAQDPQKFKNLLLKSDNETKQELKALAGDDHGGRWLTWVIIGLVLILIAFFLPSPLSGIFHLIGSILVVLGLIFLLLHLL